MGKIPDFQHAEELFTRLQKEFCHRFASLDNNSFLIDKWQSNGKKGSSNILQNGSVWEKVGVNFSSISATSLPPAASVKAAPNFPFKACGISVVAHPRNPYIPASHLNLRFFYQESKKNHWWFGGGMDLTPYYPQVEDCVFWHQQIKSVCDQFDASIYQEFKKNCDEYFYLPHRQEMRGIGGIFFDDLNRWEPSRCFAFVTKIARCYLTSYMHLAKKYKDKEYSDKERDFQLHRRGRYVEFNLLYDRGTLFGLQSKGRIESIFMSLPPLVIWEYNYSDETAQIHLAKFLQPHDWTAKDGIV